MWNLCLGWSENKTEIVASLPRDADVSFELNPQQLEDELKVLKADKLLVDQKEVDAFIVNAREHKPEAYEGTVIARKTNAQLDVVLSDDNMLASIKVTGAYGGRGLRGPEVIYALANARVTKGINKLALKKVLVVSTKLKPGSTFVQPVAVGKQPIKGKDSVFKPLVKDITKRILKPKEGQSTSDKIDLRNLGEIIDVGVGDQVMRRIPATKGTAGYTVQGIPVPAQEGQERPLKPGKGTQISPNDPNLLIASVSGTPLIKDRTIEVDNAMFLNNVGVNTGHVKFKGNVIIGGNIESGMIVKATGSITVGGFIESADVEAHGDIQVSKGIIGHTVSDGQPKSCLVKTKGTIRASYAQYSDLVADEDIELSVHSMNNDIVCGNNLTVMDASEKNGTLSGGMAKVGGRVRCLQLGVEGDAATDVEVFSRYQVFKDGIADLKQRYKQAQQETMDVVRKELEYKKRPKSERSDEELVLIEQLKQQNSTQLEDIKQKLDLMEAELEVALTECTVEAKEKVFTRVTVKFGDEQVTTKRSHGGCSFQFNQYEIKVSANLEEEDVPN